jgi:DNA-directed RNA polymerase specialized sigma subunit
MKTYRVIAERHDKWWLLEVPEIPGTFSQVRRLDQVDEWIRDAISLMLEIPEDSFNIDLDVRLPKDELAELRAVKAAQKAVTQAQEESSTRTKSLVAKLKDEGLTVRDIGTMLGVSYQRVSQLSA